MSREFSWFGGSMRYARVVYAVVCSSSCGPCARHVTALIFLCPLQSPSRAACPLPYICPAAACRCQEQVNSWRCCWLAHAQPGTTSAVVEWVKCSWTSHLLTHYRAPTTPTHCDRNDETTLGVSIHRSHRSAACWPDGTLQCSVATIRPL